MLPEKTAEKSPNKIESPSDQVDASQKVARPQTAAPQHSPAPQAKQILSPPQPQTAPPAAKAVSNNVNSTANTTNARKVSRILSIDLGRTSTKVAINNNPDEVILIDANVKELSLDDVRDGIFESYSNNPLSDLWLEYQGIGYAIGQLAADYGANLGVEKPKVEGALIRVLAAAGYFNISGQIFLVVSLPYLGREQFEQEREHLSNLLKGVHLYNFRGKARSIEIVTVWVIPEGFGSLVWSAQHNDSFLTQVPVAVVDIGHRTTDFLMVDKFRFGRAVSQSVEFGMSDFYETIAAEIDGADSQSISLIEAVHKPKGERYHRPRGALKPTNLDEIIPEKATKFVEKITTLLIEWLPERVTHVLITGGGGEVFAEDIKHVLTEAHVLSGFAVPSRKANVLGQYLYAETQLRNAQQQ